MEEQKPFDFSEPFIAIVPDKWHGGYFDKTNAVYLVNPLEAELQNVATQTGGFFSDEDGVYQATPVDKTQANVPPHSSVLIERTSDDEFDELVCWWEILYDLGGARATVMFNAGKGLNDTEWFDIVPILGRGAHVVRPVPMRRG